MRTHPSLRCVRTQRRAEVSRKGTPMHDTHKDKPSGQGEDQNLQTSHASFTKTRGIKVPRKSVAPTSSTSHPRRERSHVNAPATETLNLSDSEHEEDENLKVGVEVALPAIDEGVEETITKNDVYAALWAMLDAESENEDIPGQWDLNSVLNNWGKVEPDVDPAGVNQGPPPAVIL
ncbi:hypothetical protein PIB30_042184 [Stylosanthes scabra]|uniref:Uncharacterized protein n=1 Tax=Stylosanthes scabra TaxID=79078 RepID=A0ABU6TFU8_9FABA|nr:hypothetical protein [Stylosanthes scabra]